MVSPLLPKLLVVLGCDVLIRDIHACDMTYTGSPTVKVRDVDNCTRKEPSFVSNVHLFQSRLIELKLVT